VLAYIYAVLYSPTYRQKYAQELRTDFPRIPSLPMVIFSARWPPSAGN
jgi:predicted helicase